MTTPHNHVLIDYENVQPEVASRLAPGFFKVWVFVGALQNKVKFDLLDLVQAKGGDAKVIRMGGTGPNALEFTWPVTWDNVCPCDRQHRGLDPMLDKSCVQSLFATWPISLNQSLPIR